MSPGYEALRNSAAWFDISDRARIRLTGPDRIRLLHALATNVIEGLQPGQSTETFFLTPQGRIVARCRVHVDSDSVLLETEAVSRKPLLDYLDSYIIMDDVVVADETERTAAVAVEGPQAETALVGLELGRKHPSALTGDSGCWIETDAGGAAALKDRLASAQIPEASAADRETVRVENRRPLYGVDYSDANIPHETQLLDVVSFDKGCYVGQEIVERVHSRGQVNRLLTPIELKTNKIPDDLEVRVGDRSVGRMTSPTASPRQDVISGFAVVRREALESSGPVTVGGESAEFPPWP